MQKINDFLKIQENKRLENKEDIKIFYNKVIDAINKLFSFFNGSIVDVGCGHGYSTLFLKEKGLNVCGIDAILFRIENTKKLGIDVKLGMMEKLPFKDKEKDTGFYSHVLEHAFDFKKAVLEAKRVFKRLIIIVPIEKEKIHECHTARIENEKIIKNNFPGKILYEAKWNRFNWKDKKGNIIYEYVYIVDLN